MKRMLILGAALVVAATTAMSAVAAGPVPFPAPKVGDLFVAAQTVTTGGVMSSFFTPGSSVVFRAYAVDPKTKMVVGQKSAKYFYVTIPNQPNVKLTYDPTAPGASAGMPWTGTWVVPASYPAGGVSFKVLVQVRGSNGHQLRGEFVQMPSKTASLNISPTGPAPFSPAAPAGVAGAGAAGAALNLALYVDSVNGTAPAGTQPRTVGCTQTNVYKRGERVVIRAWGTDLATGDVLTNVNVDTATFSIPGQPVTTMAWSAHGSLYFWSGFWIVPAGFPLGTTTVHIVFTDENGKTGTYDYTLNIIP